MLTISSGTYYILNGQEDVYLYVLYAISSEKMPCYSYPVSLVNINEIHIDLSCKEFIR